MEHLLNIRNHDGQSVVSARELYEFLEVKTDFTNWCKRMFEYGFIDGADFTPILAKSIGGRPSIDYALSLECAKEISMLQRSERGKEARLYFIQCEKRLAHSPENMIKTFDTIQKKLDRATATIHLMAPKAKFVDELLFSNDTIPSTVVAKTFGMSCRQLHKLLVEKGIGYMFKNKYFKYESAWLLKAPYERNGVAIQKLRYRQGWGKRFCSPVITGVSTYWTPKGILFLHQLLNHNQLKSA